MDTIVKLGTIYWRFYHRYCWHFQSSAKTFLLIVALTKTSSCILIVIFVQKVTLGLQTGAAIVQRLTFGQF